MWITYNANPAARSVGDCTIRAVSKVLGQSWEQTYIEICLQGLMICDMPSANEVWGRYLISKGFKRHIVKDACKDLYTVSDFCRDHPKGTYVLALSGHAVAIVNGNHYDTFDSGQGIPLYFWVKEN